MTEKTELSVTSRWQDLHDRGVVLEDKSIDFVTSNVVDGANEAVIFFVASPAQWPKVIFSDNLDRIGYAPEARAINIPIGYLNRISEVEGSLSDHLQKLYSFDDLTVEVKYSVYLKLVGREETVHHFQRVGHPDLKGQYSEKSPESLSELDRLLCDIEVEARKIVDSICISLGEEPIWQRLDDYLLKRYPEKYGKSLDELLALMVGK